MWLATATAGLTLLRAGGAARRAAAPQAVPADSLAGALVRTGAVPLTAEGKPPPGPHVKVGTPPGEHPLLEFSHPALGVTGIACWMMFTFVHYRPLAWIAFAILVVTLLVGLGWLSRTRRSGGRQEGHVGVPVAADLGARPGRDVLDRAHGAYRGDRKPRLTLRSTP